METGIAPAVDIDVHKKNFARYWLDDIEQPYKAALRIFVSPADAYRAAELWRVDPVVLAEVQRLKSTLTEEELLPTKAVYLREILDHARKMRQQDPEIGFKYDDLYSKMRGHVEKPAPVSLTQNNVTINRVMVQKDHGDDGEFAVTLEAQQTALMHENDSDVTQSRNVR